MSFPANILTFRTTENADAVFGQQLSQIDIFLTK